MTEKADPNDTVVFKMFLEDIEACDMARNEFERTCDSGLSPKAFYTRAHPAWKRWLIRELWEDDGDVGKRPVRDLRIDLLVYHDGLMGNYIVGWPIETLLEADRLILERFPWSRVQEKIAEYMGAEGEKE
jgi:hypothetical protein